MGSLVTIDELKKSLEAVKEFVGDTGEAIQVDNTLTIDDDHVLGVTTPVNGIVTQAEFNALPEEEQNRGMYVIKDAIGVSAGSSNNVYSTEETVIGTWIDGKPLYRRVFFGTSPKKVNNIEEIADLRSLNIAERVNLYGFCANAMPVNWFFNTTNSGCTWIGGDLGHLAILMYTTMSSMCNRTVNVVLEYTKTTD